GLADAQQLPIQPNQNDLNRNVPAPQTRNPAQANGKITERQAVNLAKQRFAGNILRISLVGEGENQRYQIRMENEGKVFTVFVHVATGRVSGPG
ncbi:MAG: PepSY domain-containing protein, partial [Pseudohongiella sp.]|nr:PepSY domain-containing protein [Pseudohongiella sp.]